MKVVHITSYDRGGAGKACVRIHQALLSIGVDSKLLVMNKSDNSIQENYQAVYAPSVSLFDRLQNKTVHLLKKVRLYKQPLSQEQKYLYNRPDGFELFSFPTSEYDLNIQQIIKDADIINFHWMSGFLDYPSFFKVNQKKLVWTLHDMNPFTGGCHYSSGCDLYADCCSVCPQLLNTRNPSYSNHVFKVKSEAHASIKNLIVVTPSAWLGELSSKSALLKYFRHEVIRYACDESIFKSHDKKSAREILGLPDDIPILLFVSDSVKNRRKGFQFLYEALEKISQNQPILLACAGNDDIKDLSKSYIHYLGKISDERMMSLAYSSADFLIVPSLEDNLPNVIIESLLCGTPVIGFNNGGIKEMIQQDINGCLTEDSTSQSLANSIAHGLMNIENFNSESIRLSAIQLYNNQRIAKEYFEMYSNL